MFGERYHVNLGSDLQLCFHKGFAVMAQQYRHNVSPHNRVVAGPCGPPSLPAHPRGRPRLCAAHVLCTAQAETVSQQSVTQTSSPRHARGLMSSLPDNAHYQQNAICLHTLFSLFVGQTGCLRLQIEVAENNTSLSAVCAVEIA